MSEREAAKFMVGMSLDPVALERFHRDPVREMKRFNLSDDAMELIKSKDATKIHNAINENFANAGDVVNIVVVVL